MLVLYFFSVNLLFLFPRRVQGVNLMFIFLDLVGATEEVTCTEGRFGPSCQLTCHCINSSECFTGCISGCEPKWDGPTCQVVIENIALGGRAEQRNTTNDRNASLVVDGKDETFGHSEWRGKDQTVVTWWLVEIIKQDYIRKIDVRFKTDSATHKKIPGFSLYISDLKPDSEEYNGSHCYTDTTTDSSVDPGTEFSFRNCTRHGQFVILFNKRDKTMPNVDTKIYSKYPQLLLNEVEVYVDKGCSVGTYGQDCDQICGCCEGGVCNRSDGRCQCQEGWEGDTCKSAKITKSMTTTAAVTTPSVATAFTESSVTTIELEHTSKQDTNEEDEEERPKKCPMIRAN